MCHIFDIRDWHDVISLAYTESIPVIYYIAGRLVDLMDARTVCTWLSFSLPFLKPKHEAIVYLYNQQG